MTKYVELDSVVAEALSIIGLSGDDDLAKNFARMWAWRAVVDMPITDDALKVTKIYPKNLILKKPVDMRRPLEVALYDASDCLIPHKFHGGKSRMYPDVEGGSYTNSDGEVVYFSVDLSEDGQAYYLGTNAGDNVTYAKVRYFAYPLDSQGYPMIREEAVQTCMYYIRFMWSLRKNENQSEIANNRLMYQQESDRCRARLKSFDMSEETRKAIAASMNRMMPNFNRSRF